MKASSLLTIAFAGLALVSTQAIADDIHDAAKRLGHGVNMGNTLEAPSEGAWGLTLKEEYFDAMRQAGFDTVRLPVRWSAHTTTEAPYTIDPKFLSRVDWAVDYALKLGLNVVLNVHHFEELDKNPDASEPKLQAIWKQIAEHYRDRPAGLYFELSNEPHDKLTDERWNAMIGPLLKIVRASNPTRPVIIGPSSWNSFRNLPNLKLPDSDRNLIATFHYYEPFHFTHQGAEWAEGSDKWLGTKWTGSDQELGTLRKDFDSVAAWSKANDRPVFLGEFGCYSKADPESRIRWTQAVVNEATARGFSPCYWEFASGFGVYNPQSSTFRKPLLDAVLPSSSTNRP